MEGQWVSTQIHSHAKGAHVFDRKISFNTFNTSSVLQWKDVTYSNPGQFHDIKCIVKDRGNGKDAQVKYFMDGTEVTTHYGKDYVGKPLYLYEITEAREQNSCLCVYSIINLQMEGSSGSPGPKSSECPSLLWNHEYLLLY